MSLSLESAYVPVNLPSRGIPYRGLLPDGAVEVRAMCGAEEAILRSGAMDELAKMDKILNACVRFPKNASGQSLQPKDLTASDQFMLTMAIRVESLGSNYNVSCRCEACQREFTTGIDISKNLRVEEMPRTQNTTDAKGNVVTETLNYDPDVGIETTLPQSKLKVRLRLLTGKDTEYLARESKNQKSSVIPKAYMQQGNAAWYMQQALTIRAVCVNGEWNEINHSRPDDMSTLFQLISKMPMRDLRHIEKVYTAYDVSVDNAVEVQCPFCGVSQETGVTLTLEFFRPSDL